VTNAVVLRLDDDVITGRSTVHPGLGVEEAVKALESAAEFLVNQCGIASARLLPQKAMLLPIANLRLRRALDSAARELSDEELKRWFFASCFTQPAARYYGGVNSRVKEDCKGLENWADDGQTPSYVSDFDRSAVEAFDFDGPMSRERNIPGLAAMAILVQAGARDWSSDRSPVSKAETIHLHHMVPEERLKTWWPGHGEMRLKRSNIANFAPISAKLNQRWGATEPGKVLDSLGKDVRAILGSHAVDESFLRNGFLTETGFEDFCKDRAKRLQAAICLELKLP